MRSPAVVASDCDGTLLRSDGSVSARTRAVLARVERAGAAVVLVTARPPRWMSELADVIGGHGVVLCGNGAFTYDAHSRTVVASRLMPAEQAQRILEDLRAAMPELMFGIEGLTGLAREPDFARSRNPKAPPRPGAWHVASLPDLIQEDPGKILVRHPTLPNDQMHAAVARVVGDRGVVSHSGAVGLTEIAAPGVTKGLALAEWCAERQVRAEQVWAFGDMPNDLPMLGWAGHAVAVGNAHPLVLQAADEVTGSNDEDGVAVVLERAFGAAQA